MSAATVLSADARRESKRPTCSPRVSRRVSDRAGRRCVEPLRVVDCDEQLLLGAHGPQDVEHRYSDGVRIRRGPPRRRERARGRARASVRGRARRARLRGRDREDRRVRRTTARSRSPPEARAGPADLVPRRRPRRRPELVLPIPASPSRRNAVAPSEIPARKSLRAASSASRPITAAGMRLDRTACATLCIPRAGVEFERVRSQDLLVLLCDEGDPARWQSGLISARGSGALPCSFPRRELALLRRQPSWAPRMGNLRCPRGTWWVLAPTCPERARRPPRYMLAGPCPQPAESDQDASEAVLWGPGADMSRTAKTSPTRRAGLLEVEVARDTAHHVVGDRARRRSSRRRPLGGEQLTAQALVGERLLLDSAVVAVVEARGEASRRKP